MKILVILFFVGYWLYFSQSAVPINQLVVNAFYCNDSLPMFDCYSRVQRKNRTAQLITGYLNIKIPWPQDISVDIQLNYQDYSGIWKGYLKRELSDSCFILFNPESGILRNQVLRFIPEFVLECPVKQKNYTMGPAYVNRYRKDWELDLQFLIPPMFMQADNWQLDFKFYYENNPRTFIGQAFIEFRLLNEFMSQ